jgi:Zn ribbon nucleic-acid-binding protein
MSKKNDNRLDSGSEKSDIDNDGLQDVTPPEALPAVGPGDPPADAVVALVEQAGLPVEYANRLVSDVSNPLLWPYLGDDAPRSDHSCPACGTAPQAEVFERDGVKWYRCLRCGTTATRETDYRLQFLARAEELKAGETIMVERSAAGSTCAITVPGAHLLASAAGLQPINDDFIFPITFIKG